MTDERTVTESGLREALCDVKAAGFAPVAVESSFDGRFRIWFIIPPDTGTDDWAPYGLAANPP